jgi:hypothetical protein
MRVIAANTSYEPASGKIQRLEVPATPLKKTVHRPVVENYFMENY